MTEQLDDITLEDFERLTSYDITTFFDAYLDFTDNHYSNISNFFTGVTDVLPTLSVSKLNWLIKEKKKVIDVTILNAPSLENYRFWVLMEYVDSIGHALESANKISKWARASSTRAGYKAQVVTDYMLSQGQTLQDMERKVLATGDPDSWVNTALQNNLAEDDYTLAGGQLIKVIYQNNTALFLEGVVDNIDLPEKTYGLDIDQNIAIDPLTEDLKILGYTDTLLQSIKILTDLNVEDDPSFSDRGLKLKNTVLGGNVAGISYPAIFRDLAANFATDDSFRSVAITDIRRQQDAVYLDFTVQTRVNGTFSDSVKL